jgi:hypothetical protein
MRAGWRGAAILVWIFSRNAGNCGSAWQPDETPLRAASDEQFGAHSRRPAAAQLNRGVKLKNLYASINLQNLTYTTLGRRKGVHSAQLGVSFQSGQFSLTIFTA